MFQSFDGSGYQTMIILKACLCCTLVCVRDHTGNKSSILLHGFTGALPRPSHCMLIRIRTRLGLIKVGIAQKEVATVSTIYIIVSFLQVIENSHLQTVPAVVRKVILTFVT